MAFLTLLSWNIRILGPAKIGDEPSLARPTPYRKPAKQKAAILQTIGDTVNMLGADIVSVLEVCGSTAGYFRTLFLTAVKKATGGDWEVELIPSNKNDVYFIAYRKDAGFDVLRDSNKDVVKGLTHQDDKDRVLIFSPPKMGGQGRYPGYVAFKTDAGRVFTVICYHACMGGKDQTKGIKNIAKVAPVTQVSVDGANTTVAVSVVSGDFNVNYLTDQAAYANVTDATQGWAATPAIPSTKGNNAKTSLVDVIPNADDPSSVDFRANAYDNIFAHGSQFDAGDVDDIIAGFVNPTKASDSLAYLQECARKFNYKTLNKRLEYRPEIGKITTIPPQNATDSWRVYRRALSDHLPVWGRFTI
ncbi:MAG TPA: hypothetical protein VKA60_19655 [Blastocatellia bacterium]|nr:hypothetical protein [Blastocatellia bacterium]